MQPTGPREVQGAVPEKQMHQSVKVLELSNNNRPDTSIFNAFIFFCLLGSLKPPFLKYDQQGVSEMHLKVVWLGSGMMVAFKNTPAHSQPDCLMVLNI